MWGQRQDSLFSLPPRLGCHLPLSITVFLAPQDSPTQNGASHVLLPRHGVSSIQCGYKAQPSCGTQPMNSALCCRQPRPNADLEVTGQISNIARSRVEDTQQRSTLCTFPYSRRELHQLKWHNEWPVARGLSVHKAHCALSSPQPKPRALCVSEKLAGNWTTNLCQEAGDRAGFNSLVPAGILRSVYKCLLCTRHVLGRCRHTEASALMERTAYRGETDRNNRANTDSFG